MFKFLKKFFGPAEEVEVVGGVVVQEVADGEDALMKNAMLAMKTGKVVYGDYEDGVLTSRVSPVSQDLSKLDESLDRLTEHNAGRPRQEEND